MDRVIWEGGAGFLRVMVGDGVVTFDAEGFSYSLTKTELRSLITALINYEAELEAAQENT